MKRWTIVCLFLLAAPVAAQEPIRLPNNPALSADGQWLAFDWNGDIWIASSNGGEARQLTAHPGRDTQPRFSPDGKTIAFVSDREASPQIFTVPFHGGNPEQHTYHTAGATLQEWSPDGNALLIRAARDHFWRHAERFFTIKCKARSGEELLFDDYGNDGTLSPDGKKLLFTREGEGWWRKGYKGSRVTQVWLFDRAAKSFTKVLHEEYGCRWPMWKPDGTGFYYVGEHARGSNLCEYDFKSKKTQSLTRFKEDSVVFPTIARNSGRIVFRHLFDLYRFDPKQGYVNKLDFFHNADRIAKKKEYRVLTSAAAAAFTKDGLEIAFNAGGDIWVMDTELREPKAVCTASGMHAEGNLLFTPDGQEILCAGSVEAKCVIAKMSRYDAKKFWWQNQYFVKTNIAVLNEMPSKLKLSPDGKRLAFVLGRGELYTMDLDGENKRRVLAGWNAPDFDWSPDGKWFVYAQLDAEFNRDIWLVRSDGSGKPFNLSRHPYSEHDPIWSPDGTMIAFAGRRASGEPGAHVCMVWLNPEDDEMTARDRKLEKALEKMKARTSSGKDESKLPTKKLADVSIDFDGLHERVTRVNLGEGSTGALFWSPDSKKLAFTGNYENKAGTFTIDIGATLTPKLLTTITGANPAWLKTGNQIVWLVNGIPTSTPGVAATAPAVEPAPALIPKKGQPKAQGQPSLGFAGGYTFSVRQEVNYLSRNHGAFSTAWRLMRDHWYDAKLGNNDWTAVHKKYADMATQAPDTETLATVVQMMLGELNGSHLGFTLNPATPAQPTAPRDTPAHLGARFDYTYTGSGLKVRDVLPGGPADKKRSRLQPGDIIHKIDGWEVGRDIDLALSLNGPADREITLAVQGVDGKTRDVALRPISYPAAQLLLYDHWLRHNRKLVADASKGSLGYLHISAMSMPNFRKFEEELVSQGADRDGLVVDVRENPGGSITDHLLTALTQPVHAITVPRGGGPGYPMDRKVYVSWHKPIIVLCNQNSGSNAEIFSHAIKTLKRGQLVGVRTAGAVVSTGIAPVMDVGFLRMPTRGWFTLNDGEDMEKNGAAPHHVVWLDPCTLPQGRDAQLTRAIELLQADVAAWKARPQPKLKLSTERP